ncbi:hypothetical protein LAZ67_17003172 [Cordylochernes scorpioides]|uniref:RNA-directed DNA polymerase n=1 Tax=Cordylochernes scorpioides TaxID=51811 RepID=A0ABY6LEI4_9ARAC|nr:hypothetical protein LAZ67_17003172 [Cordylochernes scorpioides]
MKELDYALENTDLNKTPGPDGIHGKMISNLGKNGKEILLDIFNNSWKTGKLPQDWKTATIIPIKKLDKSADDPKNYRPISLTKQQLQYNKHPKYLSYTLDPEINSSKHIEEVIRKGRDRLKILKYISGREWGANATTLKLTCTSLIRPILEYGYQIYGTASETNLKSLERIQLSAARIITGLRNTCPNNIDSLVGEKQKLENMKEMYKQSINQKVKNAGEWEAKLQVAEGPYKEKLVTMENLKQQTVSPSLHPAAVSYSELRSASSRKRSRRQRLNWLNSTIKLCPVQSSLKIGFTQQESRLQETQAQLVKSPDRLRGEMKAMEANCKEMEQANVALTSTAADLGKKSAALADTNNLASSLGQHLSLFTEDTENFEERFSVIRQRDNQLSTNITELNDKEACIQEEKKRLRRELQLHISDMHRKENAERQVQHNLAQLDEQIADSVKRCHNEEAQERQWKDNCATQNKEMAEEEQRHKDTSAAYHNARKQFLSKLVEVEEHYEEEFSALESDVGCAVSKIQPPETFDFSTPNEWPKWRKRFERYLVVSGMKKKEEADKIDLFMYLMGDRADDIFRTFKFEKEEEATKIDSVLKAFDSHFCVRKNIIYERAKFNSRIQEDREPVDEFITSLYKLADSCEFEGLHEQLIRDRIVVGVRDKALSERMQLDSELTLEKAVKMVRQQEAVRQQQVDLQRPSTSQKVNQVKFNSKNFSPKQQQQPSRKKKSAKTRSRCPKCGGFAHREGQACRAEGQRCNLCSKTGHFANCCPDKQAKTAEVKAISEPDEEIGFLLEVSAVEDSSNLDDDEGECRRRWTAEIQVNRKKEKFKLDSQADVTCVPLCLFKKIMGQQRLVESDINIRAAEFSELQTVGMFLATLRNGNYEIKEKIYVIRRLSEPLLSRRACELLNLARRIEVGATRINPVKEFPEVHIPGKELLDADALSRQPLLTTEGGEDERPTSAHINAVLSSITDKDEMLTKIFEAQQEDTTLKAVVNYLEQGWPDKKKMSQAMLSYWHVKDELGVQNGLLMRSCRLVIPASMKLEILDKLHAGHFGITKTRLRARETVWWPGISEEIAETVRKCSVCIQEAVSKHEPLIPTNFPTRPWQKIGMDLFKFENKWYLVVIDYYSRFPEVIQLDRLTASVVVRGCKSIFARHGIPETVVSDNGTQFGAAREFANFARQYGFTHVTSRPRFPQSNGMAEAGVKIAKMILKKNQDPSLGLLEYRSTPLENGYSPAELLMGRKLRTTLPIVPENLNPRLVDSQTLKRKEGRRRKDMKSRYDRRCGATDMEELSEGDTVWITDMRTWGIVKQKASTPRSYMVDTPVGTLRRNRFHLRKGVTVQYPADPSTPTFSGEELVENEKTLVVDYPSNDSEDGQIRTRSGRIVKPVDRLHY